MSIVLQSSGGGQITVQEPATASNFTQNLPAADGTVMVSGNQPAFSAYPVSNQSISANTPTKVIFDTEVFDTNNNYNTANSRFTPTVAGYYQMTFSLYAATSSLGIYHLNFYKNGTLYKQSNYNVAPASALMSNMTSLIYLNGSTDYVEAYFSSQFASTLGGSAGSQFFEFSGVLVRGE
jgi:hypothetical protein